VKPPAFEYSRPDSLDAALALLAQHGTDGKVLAGGQSLIPLLSMRLAAPARLIDINALTELDYVRTDSNGVRVGALARHSTVLSDQAAAGSQPLLAAALRWVAHPTIRNRGTSVGSIVHADPAAEMPAVLSVLTGSLTVASTRGRRVLPAAELFRGPLESDLAPDELAIEAYFPARAGRCGSAFAEVSRRHGDYAVCGVAAVVELDEDLRIASARAGYLSVAGIPQLLELTDPIAGRGFDTDLSAAAELAKASLQPEADIHASAEYRSQLVEVLTRRVLTEAARSAAGHLLSGAA
jgi:CO/xanthine dehydrogenase FAD-binding subunit